MTIKRLRKKLDKMDRRQLEWFAIHCFYMDMISYIVILFLLAVIIRLWV
jgi:hypothetical protein